MFLITTIWLLLFSLPLDINYSSSLLRSLSNSINSQVYILPIILLFSLHLPSFDSPSIPFSKSQASNSTHILHSLTTSRLRRRNQLRSPRHHHPLIQRPPPCPSNRRFPIHNDMGPPTIRLPPLPHIEDRKRRPVRRQAGQLLQVPRVLDLPDVLGLDCLTTCDDLELAECDEVPSACVWHGEGYRGRGFVCGWVRYGECERCSEIYLPE